MPGPSGGGATAGGGSGTGSKGRLSDAPARLPDGSRIKYRTDLEKVVLGHNFDRRGWQRVGADEDWNFFWASVSTIKTMFNPDTGIRLHDMQVVNHFPNHLELTRKDLMVKNIKRYKKDMEREGVEIEDFIPVTYILPADYSLFVEEFRRNPHCMWIVKPSSKAQGRGIFLINRLNQIRKFDQRSSTKVANVAFKDAHVISRYIDNPLLIGGKKFDMRIYVLVTSYRPLKVYLAREGFCRFCNVKYSNEVGELDNLFIHLTNVAIQKHNEAYSSSHGGKWSMRNLRTYLEAVRGDAATGKLFSDIEYLIVHSLKAVQGVIVNDKHCFECYGYDVIIDDTLKPWLVEINASPSLTVTTTADRMMKSALINDVLDIVMPAKIGVTPAYAVRGAEDVEPGFPQTEKAVGGFDLLYDEATETDRDAAKPKRPVTQRWR